MLNGDPGSIRYSTSEKTQKNTNACTVHVYPTMKPYRLTLLNFPAVHQSSLAVPLAFSLFFPDLQLAVQTLHLPELWLTPQLCSASLIYVLRDPWCAFSQLSLHMVLKIIFSGICLWHQIDNRALSPLSAWYMSATLKVLKTYCWPAMTYLSRPVAHGSA